MKELLLKFQEEKSSTFKKKVGSNPIYDEIVKKISKVIEYRLERTDLYVKPSVGITNYAIIPWICLISKNPRIARNAKKGIYIVILFNKTGDSFYLCLGQGYTYFEEIYRNPKERKNIISDTVNYFQKEIEVTIKNKYGFTTESIYLGDYISKLGKGYTKTTILSKKFNFSNFDENDFFQSLSGLIGEYDDIIMHFGDKSYNEVIEIITNQLNMEPLDIALESIEKEIKDNFIELRDIQHKPVMVIKGEARTLKYSKIRQNIIKKKSDYLKLAREKYQTGTIGERIALRIERDRLLELGLDPDIYVKRVSIESDSYGYDIESVDYYDGKLKKIFIEVKATKDISDSTFFVSKNELEVSKEKDSYYRVIRIFDITSIAPKYYIAHGNIEENFYLDPITFSAIYKFKVF